MLQSSTLLYDLISVKLRKNIYNRISGELNFFLLYISVASFLKIMIMNILRRMGVFLGGREGGRCFSKICAQSERFQIRQTLAKLSYLFLKSGSILYLKYCNNKHRIQAFHNAFHESQKDTELGEHCLRPDGWRKANQLRTLKWAHRWPCSTAPPLLGGASS